MESKLKHLEMIQGVINRMASNSFVFKGWSITIIAGLTAFATKDTNLKLIAVSVVATVIFWLVDAYYLMLERAFRELYKNVASKKPRDIDFLMNAPGIGFSNWLKTLFRPILYLFYGSVLVLLYLTFLMLRGS